MLQKFNNFWGITRRIILPTNIHFWSAVFQLFCRHTYTLTQSPIKQYLASPAWLTEHSNKAHTHNELSASIKQVMWLVVTEVRSETFGLVTTMHVLSMQTALLRGQLYFSPSGVVSHAFSVHTHYVCIRCSGIILTPFLSHPPLLS